MNQALKFLILVLLLSGHQLLAQQKEKPKVALVLSGGGARGIAHIPTLQVMDSLGIVPDLVVGTSMGSIVGALYAMGYSADSIAAISRNTNWDNLFGGSVALSAVSNEEKSEYQRYQIELEFKNGKPSIKNALLNDQNLREFFSELTYPVYDLKSFEHLSIPFIAMATDIVNGKEVMISEGSLGFAMRASMSIPGVFEPMPYEDVLLVDGGVLNNFPVDVAKNWGADIIIGSDVSGGMKPKEELANLGTLLFQTGMLASNKKNETNRQSCYILIDHTKYLTHETGDFNRSDDIYQEGMLGTNEQKEALRELAEELKKYEQLNPGLPEFQSKLKFDTIAYDGISELNLDMVKYRTNLKPNEEYSIKEIIEGVNNAIGTNLFDEISFYPFKDGEDLGLEINAVEKFKHQIKGSIHYDSYQSVGLILNYTGRNIIGRSSRILLSADISENPRLRAQYQKNFGSGRDYWFRSEYFSERLTQKAFINGSLADNLKYHFYQIDNSINKNIDPLKSYVGLGLNYESTTLRPTVDPDVNSSVFGVNLYRFKTFNLYGHYRYNTMESPFYPSRGTLFHARAERTMTNDARVIFFDPESSPNISGEQVQGFTKLSLEFEKRIPLNDKLALIFGLESAYTFLDDQGQNELSYAQFGYGSHYFLGGNISRPRRENYMLPGLKEDELAATQFTMLDFSAQYALQRKLFLTPHLHLGTVGFEDFSDYVENILSPGGNWEQALETSFLMTAGVTASYNSFLGPVDLDVSWVNNISKIRVFFGVGIPFGRSN